MAYLERLGFEGVDGSKCSKEQASIMLSCNRYIEELWLEEFDDLGRYSLSLIAAPLDRRCQV